MVRRAGGKKDVGWVIRLTRIGLRVRHAESLPAPFTSSISTPRPCGDVTAPPSGRDFAGEPARDDGPQDVVRSLADRHEGRVTVEALDLVVGGIAVAAMDAHRLERGFDAYL